MTGKSVSMNSLVIPVYKNEANLDRLLAELVKLAGACSGEFEVVFVVDGSPDRCLEILRESLPSLPLRTQLLSLSRNFGSFAAIAAGLESARGDCMAVMAADLQEPPELVLRFFEVLGAGTGGHRFRRARRRSDPWLSEIASNLFWFVYRKLVIKDMPRGGSRYFRLHPGGTRPPAASSGCRYQPDRAVVLARLSPRVHRLRTPAAPGG